MLLNITPSGNEFQRKMLLEHSSKIRNIFLYTLCLIPIAIFVGNLYSPIKSNNEEGETYVIERIVRGNTIVLNNGTQVELLGIAPDYRETHDVLTMYEGSTVVITPDSSSPYDGTQIFPSNKVYAYVSLSDDSKCLNSDLLKNGDAKLVITPNLKDSLQVYNEYAKLNNSSELTEHKTPLDFSEFNFDPTQYILDSTPIKVSWSRNGNDNITVLKQACLIDDCTKNFANQLAAKAPGTYNMRQVCEIFNYCYNNWRYVNDPSGQEYLASSSQSIASHLTGDCDDYAVLMASCIIAIGGNASIILAYDETSGHAYAEVEISSMNFENVKEAILEYYPNVDIDNLCIRQDSNGRVWLNLDWSATHPGGEYWGQVHIIHTCIDSQWGVSQ